MAADFKDLLVKWIDQHDVFIVREETEGKNVPSQRQKGAFVGDKELAYVRFYSNDPPASTMLHESAHAFVQLFADQKTIDSMNAGLVGISNFEEYATPSQKAELEKIFGEPLEYQNESFFQTRFLGNLVDERTNPGLKWPNTMGHPLHSATEFIASFSNSMAYGDANDLASGLEKLRKLSISNSEFREAYSIVLELLSESSIIAGQFAGQLRRSQTFFGEPPPAELTKMEKNLANFNLYLKSLTMAENQENRKPSGAQMKF